MKSAPTPSTSRAFPVGKVRAARALLAALEGLGKPGDAYRLARLTGASAMDTGRLLHQLEQLGWVVSPDPAGTLNDLARQFTLVDKSNPPAS